MSFISNVAYPRSMTGASGATGLWKSFENQGYVANSGVDQFEIIDNVFSSEKFFFVLIFFSKTFIIFLYT